MTWPGDERREVAARLRERRCLGESVQNFVVRAAFGVAFSTPKRVFALPARLADLIDPTCNGRLRVVEDADGRPVNRTCCSRCGTRMYGSWRYCAKCGARVVMTNGD